MSEFLAAVRNNDGSKNMYLVSDVESHAEAYEHVRKTMKPRAVLVCIQGGKSLKRAPIPEDQTPQEQTA